MNKYKIGDIIGSKDNDNMWFIQDIKNDRYLCVGLNNNWNHTGSEGYSLLFGNTFFIVKMNFTIAKLLYMK